MDMITKKQVPGKEKMELTQKSPELQIVDIFLL